MSLLSVQPHRHAGLSFLLASALMFATSAAHPATPGASKPTTRNASTRPQALTGTPYASRAEVMAQADDIAQRRDLDAQWVRQTLGQARHVPLVAKLITPVAPGTAKNWRAYRARFIEPVRVQAGVKFWRAHAQALQRAEATYGVPAEFIVGILGVETLYGKHTGNFRVLDALATLAFDFPMAHPRAAERSALFKNELEQFLQWHSRAGTDPTTVRGSFAGAMGLPQFLPSSWVKYAVDFDGDGKIDLLNPTDAIGSVAHYFQAFGWQPGQATHYPVQLGEDAQRDTLLAPDILPTFSAERLQSLGLQLDAAAAAHRGPMALVELQNGDPAQADNAPTYVLGTENFYTITRYNWSSYYAMAVIELGNAVRLACKACANIP